MFDRDSMLTDNMWGALLAIGSFPQPLVELLFIEVVPLYVGLNNLHGSTKGRRCPSTTRLNEILQLKMKKVRKREYKVILQDPQGKDKTIVFTI